MMMGEIAETASSARGAHWLYVQVLNCQTRHRLSFVITGNNSASFASFVFKLRHVRDHEHVPHSLYRVRIGRILVPFLLSVVGWARVRGVLGLVLIDFLLALSIAGGFPHS